MNSLKVFLYEIKMIISSKIFIGFLLITIVFSYSLMRNLTMVGVANTAPFSAWSYSSFLCGINSLLIPLLLLLCARIFDKKELRIRPLIFSTPISDARYYLIKGIAVYVAFILAAVSAVALSFVFYASVFHYSSFAEFLLPIALFLMVPAIFIFGLGMLLGKINEKLPYLLIPVVFMAPILKFDMPVWIDIFCGSFISHYPQQLQATSISETIGFTLPSEVILSRLMILAIGLILYAAVCSKGVFKNRKGISNAKK